MLPAAPTSVGGVLGAQQWHEGSEVEVFSSCKFGRHCVPSLISPSSLPSRARDLNN